MSDLVQRLGQDQEVGVQPKEQDNLVFLVMNKQNQISPLIQSVPILQPSNLEKLKCYSLW